MLFTHLREILRGFADATKALQLSWLLVFSVCEIFPSMYRIGEVITYTDYLKQLYLQNSVFAQQIYSYST